MILNRLVIQISCDPRHEKCPKENYDKTAANAAR